MKKNKAPSNGLRSGPWSANKYTNLTPYSPYHSQVDSILKTNWGHLEKGEGIFYAAYKAGRGWEHPLSLEAVKDFMGKIPQEFTRELKAVFLCPGSRKQLNFRDTCFGCYDNYYNSIFLFPFFSDRSLYYKTKPKPSECLEFERHGAIWNNQGDYWVLEFSPEALKSFYLRDVLVHEIGHHVDNIFLAGTRNDAEKERFAEWFALEFGMRNVNREVSELGKVIREIICIT